MTVHETLPPTEVSRSRRRLDPAGNRSLGRSAANHLVLVVVLLVTGVVLGTAGGLAKAPVYKAQARLIVGKTVDLANVAAVAGLATAGQQIAADYSRLVGTATVSSDVAHRLRRAPTGRLSASPVSGSPVILVDATGTSPNAAQVLASAGSLALVDAVNLVNQQTAAANDTLVQQYQAASVTLERDTLTVGGLNQQIGMLQSALALKPDAAAQVKLDSLMEQLVTASAAVDTDRLQTSTLQNQYQSVSSPDQQASKAISALGPATGQGNNRNGNVEIGLIIGAVAGLVAGIAAATLLDLRRSRRTGTP